MPRCARLQDVLVTAKAGDILLTNRPRRKVSTLIRVLSGSPVSHAILCLGPKQFVMAHLPVHENDTVIQKYDAEQLQREEWDRMYCYRHQGLDLDFVMAGAEGVDVERKMRADAVSAVLDRAEDFAKDPKGYKFATWDMVVGAVLASMRPGAWVLRAFERTLPGFGPMFTKLRNLLAQYAGGEAQLFCSEFVSRCFIEAAANHQAARIDTSFMIMRHWAAILSGEEPEAPPVWRSGESPVGLDDLDVLRSLAKLDEVQPSDEMDELELVRTVQELEQAMTGEGSVAPPPDAPVRRSAWLTTADQGVNSGLGTAEQQIMSEMHAMHDVLASFEWPQPEPARRSVGQKRGPDIADFITPVDLLRSPSLRAIAWWDAVGPPPAW